MAIKSPIFTLSPSLTLSSLSTPAAEDGISIAALSDSTVIKDCSILMVSPTLTRISITETSLKSPMSGTLTSTGPEGVETGAGTGADSGAGTATEGVAAEAVFMLATGEFCVASTAVTATAATSSDKTMEPSLTLSPTATLTSFTTPAWLDGISIDALSLSTVRMD